MLATYKMTYVGNKFTNHRGEILQISEDHTQGNFIRKKKMAQVRGNTSYLPKNSSKKMEKLEMLFVYHS